MKSLSPTQREAIRSLRDGHRLVGLSLDSMTWQSGPRAGVLCRRSTVLGLLGRWPREGVRLEFLEVHVEAFYNG